jgi:hypothetical protein
VSSQLGAHESGRGCISADDGKTRTSNEEEISNEDVGDCDVAPPHKGETQRGEGCGERANGKGSLRVWHVLISVGNSQESRQPACTGQMETYRAPELRLCCDRDKNLLHSALPRVAHRLQVMSAQRVAL